MSRPQKYTPEGWKLHLLRIYARQLEEQLEDAMIINRAQEARKRFLDKAALQITSSLAQEVDRQRKRALRWRQKAKKAAWEKNLTAGSKGTKSNEQ